MSREKKDAPAIIPIVLWHKNRRSTIVLFSFIVLWSKKPTTQRSFRRPCLLFGNCSSPERPLGHSRDSPPDSYKPVG